MDKSKILMIAILVLVVIGLIHSINNRPTTTKTIVVREPPHYYRRYGYVPPPPHYNPYKAQYY